MPFVERSSLAGKCLLGDANQEADTSLFLIAFMSSLPAHLLSIFIRQGEGKVEVLEHCDDAHVNRLQVYRLKIHDFSLEEGWIFHDVHE